MDTILTSIFKDPFNILDYNDILQDKSINGTYKYLFNFKPDHNRCPGAMILHYLLQFSEINNTIFSYNCTRNGNTNKLKKLPLRIPIIPFKNYKCNYNNYTLWISNITTSKYLTEYNSLYPPCMLVISVDTDIKPHSEFVKTSFMDNLLNNAKIWHMTNILGESYNEDDFFEVYTYSDGYWELSKGNRIRSKETLFLEENFYDDLINKIRIFSNNNTKSIYRRLNIPYKLNVLLHGPPGTGKTSFIEIMATELKRNIRFMQITPKITDDQFSKAISTLDDQDILVCEDIDCLFTDRKKSDSDKNAMTFSGLLNCFDGINGGKNGLIVFMTTNYKCNLDNALTRPGRIDIQEEFNYMTRSSIARMVKFYLEDNFKQNDFDKLYAIIENRNITGAIMSNFLLMLLLNKEYNLYNNRKILLDILKDNDYEKQNTIEKNLYI